MLDVERSKLEGNLLQSVDLDLEPTTYLKRAAYHFLYTTKDKLEDLKVYRDWTNPLVFILKGSKAIKKVHLQSTQMDDHG